MRMCHVAMGRNARHVPTLTTSLGPESFASLLRSTSATAITLTQARVRETAPPRILFNERATHDFPIVVPVALTCMQLLSGGHPLLTFSTQASYAFHSGLKAWARVADTSFDLSDYKVS